MSGKKTPQSGFTLLELLIAMSLLGILLVMLYSGLQLGIKSWEKGEAYADQLNALRLTQEFLRRQLRQSVTVYRNDSLDGRQLYFTGESDRVGWIAPMLRYLGLGGLYYMELDVVGGRYGDADSGGHLRLRWFPYSPSNERDIIDDELAGETILLSGIEDFKLQYFGAEKRDDDPQWLTQWESVQDRPMLIKLTISLTNSVLIESWPELVVPVLN